MIGSIGLPILLLVIWSLIDPLRFGQAGKGLSTFSGGLSDILIAPLKPIGVLGGELAGFGRGFQEFGGGVGTAIDWIWKPLQSILDFLFNLGPLGTDFPISGSSGGGGMQAMTAGTQVTESEMCGVDSTGVKRCFPVFPKAEWADKPETQFLEEVLLRTGCVK